MISAEASAEEDESGQQVVAEGVQEAIGMVERNLSNDIA